MKDQNSTEEGIQIKQYTFDDPTTDMGTSMGEAAYAFAADTDLATWDMATACGSCHIGGSVVEFDRNGVRHSQRPMSPLSFNADQNYVLEMYDTTTGLPIQYNNPFDPSQGTRPGFGPAYAMWSMPGTFDNKFNNDPVSPTNAVIPGMFVNEANGFSGTAQGWAPQNFIDMGMAVPGQMMMPNVREMDCFFCHLSDFNNIISSVATQMGYLNAAPSLSSGLMNMFSQTYNPGTVVPTGAPVPPAFSAFGQPMKLSGSFLSRLNGEPLQENCRQCHTPTTMKNFSDMFDKFLAAAPMDYDPTAPGASLINGMVMPKYDLNAPFVAPGGSSAEIVFNYTTFTWEYAGGQGSAAGPFGLFPMALDTSWAMDMNSSTVAGGNNPGMSGPLYYAGGMSDQNANKKATIPFPRADFFKRGDIWDNTDQEVHYRLGCAGCHYNSNSTNADLNQCDPGRGRTRMGGVESGQTLNGGYAADGTFIPPTTGIDTHDTVKRCQDCHVTGQNVEGIAIDTFGAPNPTAAHTAAGLLSNLTQALRLDSNGNKETFTGNHLDVIDCTVCHIYKKAMTVRALDSTSGNRYPTLIGFQAEKGMMAMFTDPMDSDNMSDGVAIGAFTNNMMGMGYTADAVTMMLGMAGSYGMTEGEFARYNLKNPPQEWTPIYGWHDNTPKTVNGAVNPNWRMRLVPINFIVAQMFDDSTAAGDMNGDNAEADSEIEPTAIKWDPPISRDMKAGMNFGAGPFGTIPVGFGNAGDGVTDGAYQSAYNPDFTFSGAFKWVGAYGGNAILTTPEEINAYKAYRAAIGNKPAVSGLDRDWSGVQLVFQGGNPFQVTHNVVDTDTHVLGKKVGDEYGCKDCHAPGADFFSGDYDMTGTAVPASNEYQVVDPNGLPTVPVQSNMMMRPIIDYEVVADHDDLRTGSEAKDKATGAVLDVEFEEHGCWDGTTFTAENGTTCTTTDFVRTTDLSRSEFMYPAMDATTLASRISRLESIGTDTSGNGTPDIVASSGIGALPTADITFIGTAGVTQTSGVTLTGGSASSAVSVTAADSAAGSSYSWRIYANIDVNGDDIVDDPQVFDIQNPSVNFSAPGVYTIELRVTSVDGAIQTDMTHVVVYDQERGTGYIFDTSGVLEVKDTLSQVGNFDLVKVMINDGTSTTVDFYGAVSYAHDAPVGGVGAAIAPSASTISLGATALVGGETVTVLFYDTSVSTSYAVARWVLNN